MNLEQRKLDQLLPFVNEKWIVKRTKSCHVDSNMWNGRLFAILNAYKATHGKLTLIDYLRLNDISDIQRLAHRSVTLMKYISNVPSYRYRPHSNNEIPLSACVQWGYVMTKLSTLCYNSIHPNGDISFELWNDEINKPLR